MSEQFRLDQYELYRIILDYEALQDGFLDRIDDLNTTIEQVELHGEFAKGQGQKCLSKSAGRLKRGFGWESLGKMLKGTGLALVLVVDDDRFAPIKDQLAKRRRARMPTNVSIKAPKWLISKKNAANMRALGVRSLSPQQRKRIAKKAAKARWRKARAQSALLRPAVQAPSRDGIPPTIT